MVDWWTSHGPPVYVSVAGYLGLIKPKKDKKKGNLHELAKMFAGKGGII